MASRRAALVAVQVALALTLLVGSALMVQNFWRLTRVDPGFDASGVLTVEIGLPGSRAHRHQRICEDLPERGRALPGVRTASPASSLPLDGPPYPSPFVIGNLPGATELPVATKFVETIDPPYYAVAHAMGKRRRHANQASL
jgi:putative ABC transport system permease protein